MGGPPPEIGVGGFPIYTRNPSLDTFNVVHMMNVWGDWRRVMGVFIYTRVSSEEQAMSGLGLEAQLSKCREYCALHGWAILGEFSDAAVSGKVEPMARPGFAALQGARQGALEAPVVVYSLSRLSRRQTALWRLLDDRGPVGLHVVSATEPFDMTTATGRMMLGMLAVWSQLESDMCSERTKAALAAAKRRGTKLGGSKPLLATRPDVVRHVGELRAAGKSCVAIAFELNLSGVPAPRGDKWHETTVRRVVKMAITQREEER